MTTGSTLLFTSVRNAAWLSLQGAGELPLPAHEDDGWAPVNDGECRDGDQRAQDGLDADGEQPAQHGDDGDRHSADTARSPARPRRGATGYAAAGCPRTGAVVT